MLLRIKALNKSVKNMYKNHGHFHEGDAGLDLFVIEKQTISSGQTVRIKFGISCENMDKKPYLLMPSPSM